MIDRITQSLLKDFQSNLIIKMFKKDLFEHFVNYIILEKIEDRLDVKMLYML
jgi:hypothetical protein